MKHFVKIALVAVSLLSCFATNVSALNEAAVSNVLEKAVDGFIRPGYHRFKAATNALVPAMQALCKAPDEETYDKAVLAFNETVTAWSNIEIVRTGPVIRNHRFERILFYPDRKSTGLKQVQALLANPEENVTDPDFLPQKSVAMQGVLALEFVLFGRQYETMLEAPETFRCRYGRAIVENMDNVADELTTAWDNPDGVAHAWKNPGPENRLFRTNAEALSALLGILVHGMETVRDYRIEYFYRGEGGPNFPRRAIYWRSQNTWPSVLANLDGLQSLLKTSDMVSLLDEDTQSIVSSISFLFSSVKRVVESMSPDIEVVVICPEQQAKLDYLLLNTKDLITRLNDGYGGAIGLGAGFSFSDGD